MFSKSQNNKYRSLVDKIIIIAIVILDKIICLDQIESHVQINSCLIDQYQSSNLICNNCDDICDKCTQQKECLTCKYGQLNQFQCLNQDKKCSDGYVFIEDEKQCIKCKTDFCKMCSKNNVCYECITNFKLTDTFTCELNSDLTQSAQNTLDVSCPVGQEEKQGFCDQKQVCSSNFQYHYNQISDNTLDMVELEDKNILILINKDSVQIYSYQSQKLLSEIFRIREVNDEQVIAGTKTQNYLIILTNKFFYLFDLESLGFINKQKINNNQQNIDSKIKFLYSDQYSDKIYYISFLQNLYQIRIADIEISTNYNFLNIISDYIIFQSNDQQLSSLSFLYQQRIVIATNQKKVLIVNLNNQSKTVLDQNLIEIRYDIKLFKIIQTSISWKQDQERMFFYVMQSTGSKTTILKVEFDIQNNKVIYNSQKQIQWTNENKLSQYFKLISRNSFQQINNNIYLKSSISYKISEKFSQYSEMFLGFAEVDYFFDQINNQYFYYEQISIKLWKDSASVFPYLYQSQKDSNKLIIIIAESGLIKLYEIQSRENSLPKEKEQKIIYDNSIFDGQSLFLTTDQQSVIIKIKSSIFKLFLKDIDENKIEYKQSVQQFDQLRDVYFSKGSIFQVVVPQYLNDQSFIKYSFVLLNYRDNKYFEVIQTVQNYYGEISVLAKSIFQFIEVDEQFIVIEDDSFCSLEDQLLYVLSKRGIYVIEFHTLKLIKFIPLSFYLIRNQNILMSFTNNLQLDSDTEKINNYFDLVLIKYESGKLEVFIKLETFSTLNFSQDISQHIILFNPNIPKMIFIKYQNEQLVIIDRVYIDNQEIQIDNTSGFINLSLSFLSDTEFGFFINETQLTAIKITIKKDDSGIWIVSNQVKQEFQENLICQQIDLKKFSFCLIIDQQSYTILLFDWQKLNIVTNNADKDNNEPIDYLLINYIPGYLNYEFATTSVQEKSIKVQLIFREIVQNQNNQYTCFVIFYFDPNLEILYFKNGPKYIFQYIDIKVKIKQIQKMNIFTYSNPQHSMHNRILFGDTTILSGYTGIDDNYGYDSQSYQKQDNSFLYQDQGQVLVIKRLGQMKYLNNTGQIKLFLWFSQSLGLNIVQNENSIDFISVDTYDIQFSVKLNQTKDSSYSLFFWSDKFSTLLITEKSRLKVFNITNKFQEVLYEYDFREDVNKCATLKKNPIFACNNIGFFNFQKKTLSEKNNLYVLLYQRGRNDIARIIENDELIIVTLKQDSFDTTPLGIYDITKGEFIENKILNIGMSDNLNLYIHPKVKNQIIYYYTGLKTCGVLSFFTLSIIQDFNNCQCLYMEQIQSLIVQSKYSIAVYKLPFNPNSQPQYLYENIFGLNSQAIINSTLFNIEKLYIDMNDSSYFKVNKKNLATGQIQNRIYFMIYDEQFNYLQYWEEKEMFFSQNILLSDGDKRYEWMVPNRLRVYSQIGDIDYRYNYIIKPNTNTNTFESIDISEVFPFNSIQNDLFNNQKVKNINYCNYNKNNIKNSNTYLITFNQQLQKVIKIYFTEEEKIEELFNFQNYLFQNSKDYQISKDYKTTYKIIYLEDNNIQSKQFILGINILCKIIFFQGNQVKEEIDLAQYSCEIYLINTVVFLINQNKNSLIQLLYQQGIIIKKEITLTLQNNVIISDINTDIQGRWILILLLDSQQNKINESLFVRNRNDSKVEIKIKNNSAISSNYFFEFNNDQYLLVGEDDSSITIYLLDYNSLQSDKVLKLIQKINVNKGAIYQFQCQIMQEQTSNIQKISIYVTTKLRILYFKTNLNEQNQISELILKNMQLTHTRSLSQLKILGDKYIAVLSSIQITIYSLFLQYICRLEENTFTNIDDILLAPDNLSIIVTDNQNIYGYCILIMNERERLLLQQKFSFKYPTIYQISSLEQNNQTLMISGSSIDQIIKVKYITSFKQNNFDCIRQLISLSTIEQQIAQYNQILTENKNNPNQIIYLFLNIDKNQIVLLPDTFLYKDSNILTEKFISLQIDLKDNQVEFHNIQNIDNYQNILKQLKITNGVLIIKNFRIFQNMESLIFRNITIKYEKCVEYQFKNINKFVFDNVTIYNQKIVEENMSNNYLYTLSNIQNIIIQKFNVSLSKFRSAGLIQIETSNQIKLNIITLNNTQFQIEQPLILFKDQNINVEISTVKIIDSEISQLFSFTNTQNITIYDLSIQNISLIEKYQNRRLQMNSQLYQIVDTEDKISRESLISIKQTFNYCDIRKVLIKNGYSRINTLLFYSNEIEKIQIEDGDKLQIQYSSLQSRLNISEVEIQNISSKTNLLYLNENQIEINNVTLKNNINCICEFYNACNLTIKNFTLENNKITQYPIMRFEKSVLNIIDLTVNFTSLINEQQKELNGVYIDLIQCDFNIYNLQGFNNKITGGSFINIKQNLNKSGSIKNKCLKLDYKAYIKDSNISHTEGRGMNIQDLELIFIENTLIQGNNSTENGGGIQMINIKKSNFTNLEIKNNNALFCGGGIYLEESDLQLIKSVIEKNNAQIGGGIRYNNTKLQPKSLKQLVIDEYQNSIINNYAELFGNNSFSFPHFIKMEEPNKLIEELKKLTEKQLLILGIQSLNELSGYKNAVSSSNQQSTIIFFRLYDENNEIIRLPQKDENNNLKKLTQQNQIYPQSKLTDEINQYYEFTLEYQDSAKIILSNQNETCSYNFQLNLFYFTKFITNSEQNNDIALQQQPIQMYIKSKEKFVINISDNYLKEGDLSKPLPLIQNFNLTFRPCLVGEIKQNDMNGYYNCWKCSQNTYSLKDPYKLNENEQISCKDCPEGGLRCSGSEITPREGNWIKSGTEKIFLCKNTGFACRVGENTKEGCTEGYYGAMCESCDYENKIWGIDNKTQEIIKRYAKEGKFKCTECNNQINLKNQVILLVVLEVIFVSYLAKQINSNFDSKMLKLKATFLKQGGLLYVLNTLNQNDKISVMIKIIISYFQLICIINQFEIKIPNVYKVPMSIGNILGSTTYSIDCLLVNLGLSQTIQMVYLRLMWTLFQPILIIIILFFIFLIIIKQDKQKNARKKNLIISGLLNIFYMIFPSIVQSTIGNLSCKLINNKYYILNDLQFECFDSDYYFYNFFIGFPFFALAVSFPFFLFLVLKTNSHQLYTNINIFLSYGFFFTEYKKKYYYWEVIRIYQKILTYVIIGFFNQENTISSLFMAMLIIFYVNLQIKTQPFIYKEFNQIDVWSQITAIITIFNMVINTSSQYTSLVILSLIAVFFSNAYFVYRIIRCFLSNILPLQILKMIQSAQEKLHKLNPNLFSRPSKITVNLIRVTKNWKKISKFIQTKIIWSSQSTNGNLILSKSNQSKTSLHLKFKRNSKMSIIPEIDPKQYSLSIDPKQMSSTIDIENQENESIFNFINSVKLQEFNQNQIISHLDFSKIAPYSPKYSLYSPKFNLDSPQPKLFTKKNDEYVQQNE